MVGSAAKPQTKQKLVFCAGPSEQRAAERSAARPKAAAEAPNTIYIKLDNANREIEEDNCWPHNLRID